MMEGLAPPTTFPTDSAYRRTVEKYSGSWFAANKRIYLTEETLKKLRSVKTCGGLGSDDAAVRHLLKCYERLCSIER